MREKRKERRDFKIKQKTQDRTKFLVWFIDDFKVLINNCIFEMAK